jgi:DNA-directed RNA polymerase specialized sigma24 family protein
MMGAVGNRDRVEAVYRSVHPRLWRSLLSYTGDAELASDAEAEAFAQVLRRGDAVDDVEAWVWRSAFRIAAGLLAGCSRSTDLGTVSASTPSSGSVAEFLGLLADLSPQQRACVALRYVGAYTSPEIGELLGTSASTVRVHLNRAHATLRHTITEAEHA